MTDASPRDIEHVHNKKPAIEVDVPLKEFPLDASRALDDRDRELRDEVQRRVLKAGKGHSTPLDVVAIMAEGRRRLRATS